LLLDIIVSEALCIRRRRSRKKCKSFAAAAADDAVEQLEAPNTNNEDVNGEVKSIKRDL
jgi:hypothetical protein